MNIKDIPPTYKALSEWREVGWPVPHHYCHANPVEQNYEKENMKSAPSNVKVAKFTADELLFPFPKVFGIKEFGRRVTVCLMSERVRVAMMYVSRGMVLLFRS